MDYNAEKPLYYTVEVTKRAQVDLDNIYAFIVKDAESIYVASKQVTLIERTIQRLNLFPNGCPLYNERSRYRVCHFKRYCIFFEVDEIARTVYVVRIFHAHQNMEF